MLHFAKHANDFNVANVDEYGALAVTFLSRSDVGQNLKECRRKKGDRLRYDITTSEFGVISSGDVIRTYFKPVPCNSLPATAPRRRCHGHTDNIAYFEFECGRER